MTNWHLYSKFTDDSYQLIGTETIISGTGNADNSLLTKNEKATVYKKCPCELYIIQTIKFIGSVYFIILRDTFKWLKHLSKVEFLNDEDIKDTSTQQLTLILSETASISKNSHSQFTLM